MEDKRERVSARKKQVSKIMKEFNLLLKRKCFGTILHKNSITIQILILCEVKLSYPTNVSNNKIKTAANQTTFLAIKIAKFLIAKVSQPHNNHFASI